MTTYYTKTARYYDLLNSDQVDDIPLFLEIAKETGGPILDVGCGSGRILFPFIADGHTAHGIDENSAMISLAEHRAAALPLATQNRLTLIAGDAKQHRLPSKYALILLSYNMLMHFLELEEQLQLLRNLSLSCSTRYPTHHRSAPPCRGFCQRELRRHPARALPNRSR